MRKPLELLSLLHDGAEHSGAELAERLGVTRSAIWNQVNRLRREGIDVRATRGRGYALAHGYEALNAPEIRDCLKQLHCRAITALNTVTVTDSTNKRLLAVLPHEDIHGRALLAEYQTAGRGRRGDRWVAPPGSGLCMSLGWRFDSPPPTFSALSLVVGLSIATSLAARGISHAKLKWPNDVVCDERKLAGILIEMRSESGGACTAVIGVGINVRLSNTARALIDRPAADLESASGKEVSRNKLAATLLHGLVQHLVRFEQQGFAAFRSNWARLDALANTPVRLDLPGRTVEGVARGVDDHGALVIEHDNRLEKFMAGHLTQT